MEALKRKNEFINWAKSYPEHRYTMSTIKTYANTLEKFNDLWDIGLEQPFFGICDIEQFFDVKKRAEEKEGWVEFNRNYQHGVISASLGLFYKYLKSTKILWWPSLTEYNPNITKEQWLRLLNNNQVFNEKSLFVMAAMYAIGGAASCIQLEEKYGETSDFYRSVSIHLAERVIDATNCPKPKSEENSKLWPVLFVGRDTVDGERGNYIWKLRDELYDALTEYDISRYLPEAKEPEGEFDDDTLSIREKLDIIKSYIASKGFIYEGDLIENFYLSLKSKPFVILAGTSGTGKTRLVKTFAEAIGAKMQLVPVRPDWSDSTDLFGHVDLSGEFVKGEIFDFIAEAQENTSKPYFLCLDEMNLARVEYYLSDFLSVIETRDRKVTGEIVTEPLVKESFYKNDAAALEKYGELVFPENLYLIGTVNMDETTFPFSKKVLDRANTIEFSYVNLTAQADTTTETVSQNLSNKFLKANYLYAKDCANQELVGDVCAKLEELNQILEKANLHVGYRVRDEICCYMMNNKDADLLNEDVALDHEIMQKILPRIQGSSAVIETVLAELFVKCAGGFEKENGKRKSENMEIYLADSNNKCTYKNSAKKIAFMLRRYEEDGFTSYWL